MVGSAAERAARAAQTKQQLPQCSLLNFLQVQWP